LLHCCFVSGASDSVLFAGESSWTLIGGDGEEVVEANEATPAAGGSEPAAEASGSGGVASDDDVAGLRQLSAEAAERRVAGERRHAAEAEAGTAGESPAGPVRERGVKLTRAERREIERRTLDEMSREGAAGRSDNGGSPQ